MKGEKFTPAPWVLVGATHDEYAGGLVADVIGSDGECKTACLNIDDANLIAAAPDLYHALMCLEEYARGFNVSGVYLEDEIEGKRLLDMASDALAKAVGEKQ